MRLAEFIEAHIEPILAEWEAFARSIWPDSPQTPDPAELRDDAEELLRATVVDMRSSESATDRAAKSKGIGGRTPSGQQIERASEKHGAGRVASGLDLRALISEYRALRASVLRLWHQSKPTPDLHDLDDVTHFNESIDQSLAEATSAFNDRATVDRDASLARETIEISANRAKDVFLSILSHELRTPLNSIVGWTGLLRQGRSMDQDPELGEAMDAIERSTSALVELVEDLLDITRIINGKMRLKLKSCDLAGPVKAGIESSRSAAAARLITLDAAAPPAGECLMRCDPMRIQQIVSNLVGNAVKFTPPGGRVRITLSRIDAGREDAALRIQVSDNGQGISPDLLPHIFERFRQADSAAVQRSGGLGLGLSIVKQLVEAHGGTITAASPGPGQGSTFTVDLPTRPARAA